MANFEHERSKDGKEEHLTDPAIIEALGGWESFDLDPAAPIIRPWPTACKHYTIKDDGLAQPWHGRVWNNPPYGNKTEQWTRKMAEHGNGILLIYARTETQYWFPWIWQFATAILFLKGRLQFFDTSGQPCKDSKGRIQKAGAPSVLVAYGQLNADSLLNSNLLGYYQPLTGYTTGTREEVQKMLF